MRQSKEYGAPLDDITLDAMVEMEACRISPDQMIQSVSVDVGDPAAVEKVTADAIAKQGMVQVRRGTD